MNGSENGGVSIQLTTVDITWHGGKVASLTDWLTGPGIDPVQ